MQGLVFIATSMDGFIAREDGGIDWLSSGHGPSDGGDYGYAEFFASVDAMVLGRGTYETVLGFDGWPYKDKPVAVLSSKPVDIPEALRGTVFQLGGEPAEVAAELERRGHERVYVDGGVTIQRFLRAGLVQRMTITRIPVLLGRGLPLFGDTDGDVLLRHVATRAFSNGLVQSTYEVGRD